MNEITFFKNVVNALNGYIVVDSVQAELNELNEPTGNVILLWNYGADTNYATTANPFNRLYLKQIYTANGVNYYGQPEYHGALKIFNASVSDFYNGMYVYAAVPKFYHGTFDEFEKITDKVYPAIYLLEEYISRETLSPSGGKMFDCDFDLTFLFLDVIDFDNWSQAEYENYVLTPMETLRLNFLAMLYEYKELSTHTFVEKKSISNIDVVRHSKLFTINPQTKRPQSLFSDNLGGVEMNVTLKIKNLKKFCD